MQQTIVTLDLEGVLVPEIWIAFAEKTGIEALRRTTRDEPDYDVLMQYRLDILKENNFKLSDIQNVISALAPLDGAKDFLDALRAKNAGSDFIGYFSAICHTVDAPTRLASYFLPSPRSGAGCGGELLPTAAGSEAQKC